MFSEHAAEIIETLRFDPSARMIRCTLPLGSIYWEDELPPDDFAAFLEPDRKLVMKVFSIRISYWSDDALGEADQQFFNDVRNKFPNWPLFQRLELNFDSRKAHEETQNSLLDFFALLSEHSDKLSIETTEGGIMRFSATIDLESS